MKKNLLFKSIALAMLLLVPFIGNAQRLLTEDFEYPAGNLEGNGGWTRLGYSSMGNVLQVIENGLAYSQYQGNKGGAASFVPYGPDSYKLFSNPVYSGDVYVSALVNLSIVQDGNFFFSLGNNEPQSASGSLRGKLYAKKSENNKVFFGVARNTNPQYATTEYDLNTTVLVIMKYHIVPNPTDEDNKNDIVSLFINPTDISKEPETPDAVSNDNSSGEDISTLGSIAIYQAGSKTDTQCPSGTIDAIRVSTTWEGLFDSEGGGEEPDPTPSITVNSNTKSYIGEVPAGIAIPISFTVKGQNLKGDISVAIKGDAQGEMTGETTSISKSDAEKEEGATVTFTLTPVNPEIWSETITFSSEGCKPVDCTFYWATTAAPHEVADLAFLRVKYDELKKDLGDYVVEEKFKFTGEAIVSHAYTDKSGKTNIFIQDATGGLKIIESFKGDFQAEYTAGDKISDFVFKATVSWGSMTAYTVSDFGAPVSQGNAVEPVTITLADLKAQGARYEGCLVKVENVTITPSKAGNFGDEDTTPIYLKQAEGDNSTLFVLPGADFIGKPIPESARSITGISTSSAGTVIAPRNLADIDADFEGGGDPGTDPEEPGNEVEVGENLFLDPSFEAGKSNPILGLTFDDWNVTGAALESTIVKDGDAAVRITGAGTAKIQQEISALQHTFAEGEAYRLKLNYYVVKSQGDNDVQLQSSWEGVDVVTPQPDDLLQSFSGALSTWENKAIRFVVPAGRQMKFIFKLNVPKNAEVIFDNFGLYKLETIATGIGTTEENILSAWCENGVLCIESNRTESIDVYNLHGMLVNRTTLVPGVNTLNLSAGAYLVKAGTEVMKVLVK